MVSVCVARRTSLRPASGRLPADPTMGKSRLAAPALRRCSNRYRQLRYERLPPRQLLAADLATALEAADYLQVAVQHDRENTCKEADNVHYAGRVPAGRSPPRSFTITAYPAPADPATVRDDGADFDNCLFGDPLPGQDDSQGPPADDGAVAGVGGDAGSNEVSVVAVWHDPAQGILVEAIREPFWRDRYQAVVQGDVVSDITQIRWYREIAEQDFRQFAVFYPDGALRLASLPAAVHLANGFGASVLVGPISTTVLSSGEVRAFAQVDQIQIPDLSALTMDVAYEGGGSATLRFSDVSPAQTQVDVQVHYDGEEVVRLISMHVAEPAGDVESDINLVATRGPDGHVHVTHVNDFAGGPVTSIYAFPGVNTSHGAYSGGVAINLHEQPLGGARHLELERFQGDGEIFWRSRASGDEVTDEHQVRNLKPGQAATQTFQPARSGYYVFAPRYSRAAATAAQVSLHVASPSTDKTYHFPSTPTQVEGEPIWNGWNHFRNTAASTPVYLQADEPAQIELQVSGAPADVGVDLDVLDLVYAGPSRTLTGSQNRNPLDVTDDGLVTPADALTVINWLSKQSAQPTGNQQPLPPPFLDVSGDNHVSPVDALRVIRALYQGTCVNRCSAG
jgi:hypothetical protein